jgi:hypothetical protein
MKSQRQQLLRTLFFSIVILTIQVAKGQTPAYVTGGTGTSGNTIPLNQASQKTQLLYAPSDFTSLPINGNITKIYFKNSAAASTGTYTNFQVRFMQTTDLAFPSTSYYTTGFTVALSAALQTLTGNATAGGWFEISLPTPYPYDNTKSLVVEIQYSAVTGGISTSQTASTGRNTRCSGTSLTATTGTTNTTQNNFGMDVVLSTPCVAPPTAGTSTKLPASVVCPGTSVNLGLSGNSTGSGQTYQWQSSLTSGGPYFNIGASGSSPSLNIIASKDSFYRCEVVCGGTPSYSTPIQVLVNPGLSGTYTINSAIATGGTNYQSFGAAINALACGVTGPVVFNVATGSGPYNEQLTITQVTGASATNTIKFNGRNNRIQGTPVTGTRAIIKLDGADYITLDSLELVGLSATYGWGIHLTNGADYNTITNCMIDMSAVTSTTESNSACIVGSGSASSVTTDGNANYNLIDHNTLIGGYKGIILNGITGALSTVKNIITNNTIRDFYQDGMEFTDNDSLLVQYNDISRPTRTDVTTMAGVELGSGNQNCVVNANKIHDTHNAASSQTGAAYGVFSTADDAPTGKHNIVSNNLIYNFNSSAGIIYGLYNSSSDGVYYYHNTVVLDNQSATAANAYGFYQTTSASNIQLKNNTIFVSRSGAGNRRCINFNTPASTIISNYNNLIMASTGGTVNEVGFSTNAYATLAAWQTGTTQDANSISIDPVFLNAAAANFTPSNFNVDDKGTTVGILTDINGNSRLSATPDIGAIEFNIPICTAPPVAGATLTDNATVCKGQLFQLTFSNTTTTGAGQTYQWQSSTTQAGTYTNIPGQTAQNASISQNITNWYRVALTCSGLTAYTTPVQVVTNAATLPTTLTIDTTIAVSASNFHSLASLSAELNCKGISGPTTITYGYRNATAKDSASFIKIPGASAVNTVTIIGKGNTLVSGTGPVISFANTSYVTWDSLNVTLNATTGFGMHITNQSSNLKIRNSVINVGTTSTGSASAAIVVSGLNNNATTVGNNGSFLTIENNKIIGGYYGITMIGNVGYLNNTNNIIRNNAVSDFYLYGIYIMHGDTILIEKNDVSRPTRSSISTLYGIYQAQSRFVKVLSNKIHNTGTADYSAYPMYISNCASTTGLESEITNNLIYDIQTEGIFYGIYGLTTNFTGFKIYHNTISYTTPSASTSAVRGFYVAVAPANVDFKNNIISITGAGTGIKTGIYIATVSATFTSNTNDVYVAATSGTGANNFGFWGAANTTLATWQTASAQDANSLSINPVFTSATNVVPLTAAVDNKGTPVGVLQDISGTTRSTSTPDMGAVEFTGVAGDLGIVSVKMIRSGVCYSTNDTLKVSVKNIFGSTVDFGVDPLTINWNVVGPVLSNGSIIVNTGTLAVGDSVTVYTNAVNRNAAGNYTYSVYQSLNAVNNSVINDTLEGLTSFVTPMLSVSPKTATVTSPTQTVKALASSPLLSGGNPFISEICYYRGARAAATWPSWFTADEAIEVTGVPNSDLAGYTLEEYIGTSLNHTVTFPSGTIFSPTGTMVIATGTIGSTVASPANFYYLSGNNTAVLSGDPHGFVIRNSSGQIVDAVAVTGYTFPASAGVTPADWTGPGVTASASFAAIMLIAPDNNTASVWALETATMQINPNVLNTNITAPTPPITSGFDWMYLGSSVSTSAATTFGPYTTPGIYKYVAVFTNACGTFRDTVTITASATVPVKLVQFTAAPSNGDVLLNWSTASESNSSHFEIERSVDGKSFEKLVYVKAAGSSATMLNYNDEDKNAFVIAGANTLYYRLKMVDNDSKFEYSKIAVVSVNDNNEQKPLTVFPNPYNDQTYLTFNAAHNAQAVINVTDLTGKVVVSYSESVIGGTFVSALKHAAELETGIYFVSIEMDGVKHQAKLIKQ